MEISNTGFISLLKTASESWEACYDHYFHSFNPNKEQYLRQFKKHLMGTSNFKLPDEYQKADSFDEWVYGLKSLLDQWCLGSMPTKKNESGFEVVNMVISHMGKIPTT